MTARQSGGWTGLGWVAAAASLAACAAGTGKAGPTSEGEQSAGGAGLGGFDASAGGEPRPRICQVPPGHDDAPVPACEQRAPAESFEPVVQWTWTAPTTTSLLQGSLVTVLVGNFTDDDGNGAIDLCDVPDVLVTVVDEVAYVDGPAPALVTGHLQLLDGATGAELLRFEGAVDALVTPAHGDIDGDGLVEVVTMADDGRLRAYEHDGSIAWNGATAGYRTTHSSAQCSTVALFDLDADGAVEIIAGFEVFDAEGQRSFGVPGNAAEFADAFWCVTPTAADLTGDGRLEVLFGHQTYDHVGNLLWTLPAGEPPGHPHVANFDDDPEPEVFITNPNGLWLLEGDGQIVHGPSRPTDPFPSRECWGKPAVVHDFDGDGRADVAAATCSDYTVYRIDGAGFWPQWSKGVTDDSGLATASAFDFLGDGIAEAIYADEQSMYAFDGGQGETALQMPRSSGTLIEYPVVADVDDDASAEIVFVSNYQLGQPVGPTVTVVGDAQDRWIPSRRIWNQYSYSVTHVREDGSIPAVPKKSWESFNTFRVNAQLESSGECVPDPPK